MKHKRKRAYSLEKFNYVDILIYVFLIFLAILTIYPFYNVIILSFSNAKSVAEHNPYFWFHALDLTGYKTVFNDGAFLKSLMNSFFITIVGVSLNMFLSVTGAYALSKKDLPGRNVFLVFIMITMLFNGGLIPYYLVVSDLNLTNTIWAMIFPTAINTFYLIIMKNYFLTIPPSLIEAAKIDGANELTVLFKVILPTAIPFISAFALFYSVERWNEWWNAYIFINEKSLYPLQIYLREVLINYSSQISTQAQAILGNSKVYMQSVQMATIMVSAIPIICVYPFVQKHFVKGVMVGSIKE
ncbi:carbohydrate ABC transporter permease [Clostridium swellfunianum]|uniref:carbohydrate ABC transporter permease n=1 Tax=Clostridium swellfunianum TaxID=1367462 RepID=UPI00202FAA41|nr:carbohydrate ABC transporter permease [Clostridium swellfunianum]MCM0646857.1 carbohydrate ABC transporter permease [Clostridium swellfunianum]